MRLSAKVSLSGKNYDGQQKAELVNRPTGKIKGGIDKAGVLERVGAAIKSLSRSKEENPDSVTILIMQEVSMTSQSVIDLQTNQKTVNYWFTVEDVLENEEKRNEVFALLGI